MTGVQTCALPISKRNHEEEDHLKEKCFSRPKLLRSLCKVVGALGLSYITFFIYAPK